MLLINILCVGKLKEKYWRDACSEYIKRLSPYCRLYIKEIPETQLSESFSEADIKKALDKEAKSILSSAAGYIISLCIEGKMLSSTEIARKINTIATSGTSSITVIIGSSHGLSELVKQKSDFLLSMSDMTFPHQMARIIILEQIYRAFSINSGGKYHK